MKMRTNFKVRILKMGFVAIFASTALLSCSQEDFGIVPQSANFSQSVTYAKTVDVLWVIDTSGSMDKHRAEMAAQAPAFVTAMNQSGLDYQMAVTTMDLSATGEQGHFVAQANTPYILNAQTANLSQILSARISAQYNGAPVEQGEGAMKEALDRVTTSTTNLGFLRTGSLLVVVFLSDEDDSSVAYDYKSYLDALRPPLASGAVSWISQFMGVVPNDPNCLTSMWGYSSPGARYIALSQASGGTVQSICDLDFGMAFNNVRARILEVVTQYFLSSPPVVSSINVVVNGQTVAPDSTNGWTYDAASNSVTFHGTAIPAPDAKIQVNFSPAALK